MTIFVTDFNDICVIFEETFGFDLKIYTIERNTDQLDNDNKTNDQHEINCIGNISI